jgi:hypothetical protein
MFRQSFFYSLLLASCMPLATIAVSATPSTTTMIQSAANANMLPTNFPVYTNGTVVINHPYPGFTKVILPTNNDYKGQPGCYVACYSHSGTKGIYAVSKNIFMNGQVRVPGTYNMNRACIPTGYENKDISAEESFKTLCATKIRTCRKDQCWAGGDTGGWFGMQ